MVSRTGSQDGKGSTVKKGSKAKSRAVKGGKDHNAKRREFYCEDVKHREELKTKARERYRKNNPKRRVNPLKYGLRCEPTRREVVCDARENPFNANVFSMAETAEALGRSLVTLNRYLTEEMLPFPIMYTTSHGYKQFSKGELNLIAKCLAKHAEEFDYFHKSHTVTVGRIHNVIERYRTVNNLK